MGGWKRSESWRSLVASEYSDETWMRLFQSFTGAFSYFTSCGCNSDFSCVTFGAFSSLWGFVMWIYY